MKYYINYNLLCSNNYITNNITDKKNIKHEKYFAGSIKIIKTTLIIYSFKTLKKIHIK